MGSHDLKLAPSKLAFGGLVLVVRQRSEDEIDGSGSSVASSRIPCAGSATTLLIY
jgi:hypothetical protein